MANEVIMDFASIRDWLDKQVAWRKEGAALKNFNSQIRVIDVESCEIKQIHLRKVDVVADILGTEIQREPWDEEYDCLYFMYEGYKVFCLRDKEHAG